MTNPSTSLPYSINSLASPREDLDNSISSSHGNARNHIEQQWATNLRINLDYHEKLNKQLDAGVIERYTAAKALLLERDSKSQSLINNLRYGDRIHQEYQRKKILRKKKAQDLETIPVKAEEENGVEDTQTLLSKSEMLAELNKLKTVTTIPDEPTIKLKKQYIHGPTRSRNLWSKKSSELYGQLVTVLTDNKPILATLKNLQPETCIGMINTFIASSATVGCLDRIHSIWSFYNKSFVIRKDHLLPQEIEDQILLPIMNQAQNAEMIKKQNIQSSTTGPIIKKPITKKYMENYLASLKPGHILNSSFDRDRELMKTPEHQSNYNVLNCNVRGLLKGITPDGLTHLRPLCTPGDLLLALNDILDDTLFESAVVQVPDSPIYESRKGRLVRVEEEFTSPPKGADRLFFRLKYTSGRPDQWEAMRFRPCHLTHALRDFVDPLMCQSAFQCQPVDNAMITTEMKRMIYVIRSSLELKSAKSNHAIQVEEFIADFEAVYPSDVDTNAIDYMINTLIANVEERELLEKYYGEKEAAPFIVRNSNYAYSEARNQIDFSRPTREQMEEQQKLFPSYQLRLLHFVKIQYADFTKQSTTAMARNKAAKYVKLFAQKILRKLKSKRVLTSLESFGTVSGDAIALENSSDRLVSEQVEMDLLANQSLAQKQLETEKPPSRELKLEVKPPDPKPHTPPTIRPTASLLRATVMLHKRGTKFVDNPPPRPSSPEMGKYASMKIKSPSKSKSALDKNLEEIREGVLMELLGGDEKASEREQKNTAKKGMIAARKVARVVGRQTSEAIVRPKFLWLKSVNGCAGERGRALLAFFQKAKAERLGDSDLAENGSKPETKVDHTELEDRKQKIMEALLSKEQRVVAPLNDLLKRIDTTIQNEDNPVQNAVNEPLSFHNISTHDNLKESLCRSNNMKFRRGGFVGPIRDIYKYKTQPQKVKTPMSYSLSRRSLDTDEYSMHSVPSVISIEGYITSHSHRAVVKVPKKNLKVSNPIKTTSVISNSKHWSPDKSLVASVPSLQDLLTEQRDPFNSSDEQEIRRKIERSSPPSVSRTHQSSPETVTTPNIRLFRSKTKVDEEKRPSLLQHSHSDIPTTNFVWENRGDLQEKDILQFKDVPNLANLMTEGDELSSSSSESEVGTDTTTASSFDRELSSKRVANNILENPIYVKTSRSSVLQSSDIRTRDSKSLAESGKESKIHQQHESKEPRAPQRQRRTPSPQSKSASSRSSSPSQVLTKFTAAQTAHHGVHDRSKFASDSSSMVQQRTVYSASLTKSNSDYSKLLPDQSGITLQNSSELYSGINLDEFSEVGSTALDSNERMVSRTQSIEQIGTSLVSQLSGPSFDVGENCFENDEKRFVPTERDVYRNFHAVRPNKRQEIKDRIHAQQKEWVLESQRMLESIVSRMDPEIGHHVRAGLKKKRGKRKIVLEKSFSSSEVSGEVSFVSLAIESPKLETESDEDSPYESENNDLQFESKSLMVGINDHIDPEDDIAGGSVSEFTRHQQLDDSDSLVYSQEEKQFVERKMTKLLQLSEELALSKRREKLHQDKFRTAASRREQEPRDLAESMEKKKQARLMRKINKHVGYLKANIIDIAKYAKLPKDRGVDVITGVGRTKPPLRSAKISRRQAKSSPSPPPAQRILNWETSSDSEHSEKSLDDHKGGALWGELLSYPDLLDQEGMFDLLYEDATEDEHQMNVRDLASQLGIFTASSLQSTLSQMSQDDLQHLRYDLLQQISLDTLGATFSISEDTFSRVNSAEFLSVISLLSHSVTSIATSFVCHIISSALKNILGTASQYSIRIPSDFIRNSILFQPTPPPSQQPQHGSLEMLIRFDDELSISGIPSILHSIHSRHSLLDINRSLESCKFIYPTEGYHPTSPRQQYIHKVELNLGDHGESSLYPIKSPERLSGDLSLDSMTFAKEPSNIHMMPQQYSPQRSSHYQSQPKPDRSAPYRVNIVTPEPSQKQKSNFISKEFPQRPVTHQARRNIVRITQPQSSVIETNEEISQDEEIELRGLGYTYRNQEPKPVSPSPHQSPIEKVDIIIPELPAFRNFYDGTAPFQLPLPQASSDLQHLPLEKKPRPLEINPEINLFQRNTRHRMVTTPPITISAPTPPEPVVSQPPKTLEDFYHIRSPIPPQSRPNRPERSSKVTRPTKPLTASRILRPSPRNKENSGPLEPHFTLTSTIPLQPRPPSQHKQSNKIILPRAVKTADPP